ncbi:phage portal protein [Aliarcobacter butzleri]|uniref:phage portal protein n=1 Tax=Aliarcobacter butzleri TaxID=28197 RepID=UPI0021B333B8|nr:phage portal protein [Aliarcobacter butzleri]UXC29223.1 phage portal protein [Aliarcobacter butzleri]
MKFKRTFKNTTNKDTLEFSKASSLYGNKLFKNGLSPTGIFETPGKLDDDSFNRLKKDLDEEYSSFEKTGKPLLLEQGLTYKAISLTSSDAQWMESRGLNRENIATIFGVPVAMLNDGTKSSYNSLEQKYLEFQTGTILPRSIMIEQKAELKLLNESEKNTLFFKFLFNALLRADVKTRVEYYRGMSNIAAMNPNEVREKEDMNSYKGGDKYFMQTANSTVDNIIKETK